MAHDFDFDEYETSGGRDMPQQVVVGWGGAMQKAGACQLGTLSKEPSPKNDKTYSDLLFQWSVLCIFPSSLTFHLLFLHLASASTKLKCRENHTPHR